LSVRPEILAIPEVAHQMGLVPVLWLAWLHFRGKPRGAEWWWLAGAFFVSWLADTASHWTGHPLVGMVYPVLQAGLVGAVLLYRKDAIVFVVLLMVAGIADVLVNGILPHDVFLRTVAWLSVVGIVYPLKQLGQLRASLLLYFGCGWLAWMWYAVDPGWYSWGWYQFIRFSGILAFCWAAKSPLPHFKLSRP